MDLRYKIRQEKAQIWKNTKQDVNLLYEKVKLHPLLSLAILVGFYIVYRSLFLLLQQQVSSFGIDNATIKATLENLTSYIEIIIGVLTLIFAFFGTYYAKKTLSRQKQEELVKISEYKLKYYRASINYIKEYRPSLILISSQENVKKNFEVMEEYQHLIEENIKGDFREFIDESRKIEQSILEDKPIQNKRYQLLQKNLITKIEEAKSKEEINQNNIIKKNLK